MTFTPISRSAVSDWADEIDPLLEKMASRSGGRYEAKHLYSELASGRLLLAEIGGWRAAMVLKDTQWPTGLTELEIVGLGGEGLSDWKEAMFSAERIAKNLGFDRLSTGHARKGWLKMCAAHGWKETGVILEKDLFNG